MATRRAAAQQASVRPARDDSKDVAVWCCGLGRALGSPLLAAGPPLGAPALGRIVRGDPVAVSRGGRHVASFAADGTPPAVGGVTLGAMGVACDRRAAWGGLGCLRWAGCLSVGLAVVHQLRVLAGPSSEGHAPFFALAVPAAVLVAGAVLGLVVELAGVSRGGAPVSQGLSLRRAWLLATVALVALFVAQELLEGVLLPGHAGGLAGVVSFGGWTALPLAVGVGGVVALALAGVGLALRRAAASPPQRERARSSLRTHRNAAWRPAGVLARKLASRAPPAAAA